MKQKLEKSEKERADYKLSMERLEANGQSIISFTLESVKEINVLAHC